MGARSLEFWFEFASTYSYLAAARIEDLCAAADVDLRWRPFLLGPIFRDQGWDDSPFNLYPAKGRYMWTDMERQCAKYGLPFRRPSRFPRNGLLAARIACAAGSQAWLPAFVRATYRANFAEDRDVSEPDVIAALIREQDQCAEPWLERATRAETKQRLRDQTEEAARRGVFGAPSFSVSDQLFWGNDRLEDAIAACA